MRAQFFCGGFWTSGQRCKRELSRYYVNALQHFTSSLQARTALELCECSVASQSSVAAWVPTARSHALVHVFRACSVAMLSSLRQPLLCLWSALCINALVHIFCACSVALLSPLLRPLLCRSLSDLCRASGFQLRRGESRSSPTVTSFTAVFFVLWRRLV